MRGQADLIREARLSVEAAIEVLSDLLAQVPGAARADKVTVSAAVEAALAELLSAHERLRQISSVAV